jgi:hypothetical protein
MMMIVRTCMVPCVATTVSEEVPHHTSDFSKIGSRPANGLPFGGRGLLDVSAQDGTIR